MKKQILFIISIIAFSLSNVAAQTPTTRPTATTVPTVKGTISAGVVNSKALTLAKPSYPEAAKAVRASGAVNVQVTIDEEGNVISATAVSGHPLLRQASEQAARASKFSPTLLEGTPVKVTGVIVYNFVLPISLVQIGYELAFAEKSPTTPENFPSVDIAGSLPKDWDEEKGIVYNLGNYFRIKSAKEKSAAEQNQPSTEEKPIVEKEKETKPQTPNQDRNTVSSNTPKMIVGDRTEVKTILGTTDNPFKYQEINPVEAFKDLNSKLDTRFGADEKKMWYLNLGRILGSINAEIDNSEKTQANINELENLTWNAPANIPELVIGKVGEIVKFARKDELDAERKAKLTAFIKNIR